MTRDPFALDIETVPQKSFWPGTLYDVDRLAVEKHEADWLESNGVEDWPMELLAWRDRGEAPFSETGQIPACHPTTAHIVSVTYGWIAPNGQVVTETVQLPGFCDLVDDPFEGKRFPNLKEIEEGPGGIAAVERDILPRAWKLLAGALGKGKTLVGFNTKGFDLPMLRWRSALLGVQIPQLNWYELLYPYRHKEHVDLRLLFSDGDRRAKGTLAMWCKAFGIESEESGGKVFEWAMAGEWEEIDRYGAVEMTSLIKLFQKCEGVL